MALFDPSGNLAWSKSHSGVKARQYLGQSETRDGSTTSEARVHLGMRWTTHQEASCSMYAAQQRSWPKMATCFLLHDREDDHLIRAQYQLQCQQCNKVNDARGHINDGMLVYYLPRWLLRRTVKKKSLKASVLQHNRDETYHQRMCIRYAKVRPTALCGNEHWTTLSLDKRNFHDSLWNLRFHTATSRPYCLAHPDQRAIPPYKIRGTTGPPRDEFWLLCPLARPRPGYALYDDDVSRVFDRLIATHEPICPAAAAAAAAMVRRDEWFWDDPDAFLECEGCVRAHAATEGLDKEGPLAHRRRIREWRKYWGRQPLDPRWQWFRNLLRELSRLLLEEATAARPRGNVKATGFNKAVQGEHGVDGMNHHVPNQAKSKVNANERGLSKKINE
ncbi:hypothetical protein SODALDRAFT_354055 [Sodiomyces alkalinus F11]|uniref:Uncharacterized protein n=1 Tax=Sodiomyces alkalinus (strain CBS 110278 / VKM F-3762 / F11) TaxID=1314773 RepID=A0A3N2Q598_SODAK|nr:hypothetical protein SODALDRAFT_354055 [Sodiomyces alkalinus F11]ROT41932.1 hypothetical protein SODALDRAFT_354055 [Sodiomyces alkalinus F11]